MDALILARIQFATNISFHILFPTITIALGWVLLFFKLRFNATRDERWMDAYRFWVKVFALSFALGVVSGITMSFQFGTNWPGFMNTVGNIAGPLLAYEVLTAFFLEATFLGIMLFGWNRVSNRVHTLATFLVAFGTTMSAFWILVLNSWMQTPAGFEMRDGVAHATDWWAIVFNPSMPYRLTHMLLASGLTAAFLVAGVSAYQWLKGNRSPGVQAALRTGIVLGAVLIPLQIVAGDLHGLNTLKHQPAKIAAMEGIWETQKGAPMVVFGIPDETTRSNRFEIAIPNIASFYLTHDWYGEVKGVNDFEHRPPVAPVFFAFRVMVGVGLLMLAASWLGAWQLWRRGEIHRSLAFALVAMTFAGWIATLAGWYVTEIGRQPWLVTGVLTAAQAASKTVGAGMVASTLAGYLAVYAALIAAYIATVFYLARHAGAPRNHAPAEPARQGGDTAAGAGVAAAA
ncbi:MAG TPA: cytochrome ubiquinol oxidase subunit I [Microvirga sp.]|jgi:cytochrome d ubiquinol oxidase subunit I|nr:cytochrome ubiquinol oxidase subunit I [Microvirga sp.]